VERGVALPQLRSQIGYMPYRTTLPAIPSPTLAADHPDRGIDCEMYLERAFQALAEAAVSAGWTEDEVDSALIELAKARITMRVENGRTSFAIERAKRTRRN
jgi:hypothetical protein